MSRRAPCVALVMLAVGASAARAQVKEPAELLPASTLASIEVRQPARLARELAALLKGSAFEDMPGAMARFRAKQANAEQMWYLSEVSSVSMFFCPEMLAEGGRMRGGTLGLTGIDKEKGPRFVGVLLTGDSNVPGIFYRGTMSFGNVRLAAQCEGVSIYRERRVNYTYTAPPGPGAAPPAPTRTEVDSGPAMALLPGALVFGTVDDVKDAIRRLKGKSADPSLASVSAYREAAQRDDRPGLFAYANVAALAAAADEAMTHPSQRQAAEWRAVKALFNPKAIRSATAALTLQSGGFELHARVRTDAGEKNPLLELLPDRKAPVELLHFVPRDALVAAAANLDGERRWEQALKLLEAVMNVPRPGGGRPSEAVRELEKQLKLNLGKDVFGRLSGAAVFVDVPDGLALPVLVLQGSDAKAARALEEEALPRLLSLLGASEAPKQEEVEGGPIRSVPAKLAPGWSAVHYGRSGAVLVIGADRKRVAEALAGGRKKAGLAADEAVTAGVKELGGAAVVGVASLGRGLVEAYKDSERWANPRIMGGPTPPPGAGAPPGGIPVTQAEPGKLSDAARKRAQELARAFEPLPPLVFGLARQPDGLTLTVRQPQLRRVSAKAIDLWVESAMERAVRRRFGGATMPTPAPAIEPAPPVKKEAPRK